MATVKKKRHQQIGVRYGEWVLRNRLKVLLTTLLFVVIAASGAQHLGFSTNYRVFFSESNPQLEAFDELQKVYTKTDSVMFVVKPNDGDVFTQSTLAAVQELTEEGWKLPYATRVDSLSNFQHTEADGDELIVRDLVENPANTLSPKDLEKTRRIALSEPLLTGRVVARDGGATGINVTMTFPEKSITEVPETANAARALLERIQAKHPNVTIVPSGVVFMNNAFSESSMMDMQTIVPMMYGTLLLMMLIFLRSLTSTIATLLVIAFSAATAMGLAGWFGVLLTPPSATAPTIILTLAIADSIHVIMSAFKAMRQGMNKKEAIIESLRLNFQPIFLTSFTTSIGFLSLNFSDAPPFHDLGNMTATGVIFAYVYSMLFLPAFLSYMPLSQPKQKNKKTTTPMEALGRWVVRHKNACLIPSAILTIGLAVMIPRIELNDQFVQYFDHSIPFRGNTEFMMENLTGIYTIEYSIGAREAGGISSPEYLMHLEKYTNWLRSQPEVVHVFSMTDIFKRLNKNMHGDDPSWYKLPENQNMAAQYLLLYEFSLPYGLDLNDRLNVDKSATRVTVTLKDLSTREIRAFKNKSEKWLHDNTPAYMHAEATSPVVMFAYISQRNIDSMTTGNILALFLISLTILIALRDVRIGLFSIIPNVTPAMMGFGIWAVLVGQINMAVAVAIPVSLGIIVDDTVHFLSKYLRARREEGLSAEEAIVYAFSTVGRALLVTTLILVTGFGVLGTSAFQINSYMGILSALVIGSALVADFFLLPALLLHLDKRKGL